MNSPAIQDIPDHYSNDGLKSFRFLLEYKTGTPVDLAGSLVVVELKSSLGVTAWTFSSEAEGDHKLNILLDGWVEFPRILVWDIPLTKYTYEMKVTDVDGFVRTYFTGNWSISKKGSLVVSEATDIRGTVLYPEKGEKGDPGTAPIISFDLDDNMNLIATTTIAD